MTALLNGNGHANGHANRLPVDPTPEEIAARAARCRVDTIKPKARPASHVTTMTDVADGQAIGKRSVMGKERATLLGVPYDGQLRARLSALLKKGTLGNDGQGYYVAAQVEPRNSITG